MNQNDSNAEDSAESTNTTELSKVAGMEGGFDKRWHDGRQPARQCSARRTNGEPCRRAAINGGAVCATHGGRSPQVKAKARVRLEMAADRLAQALLGIATDDDAPAAVKLAAIRDALDRAGLSAKTAVEVEVGPSKGFEQVLEAMVTGGSRAESRARRGLTDEDFTANPDDWTASEILDAQVVDNEDGYSPAPSLGSVVPPTTPRPSQQPAPANGSGLLPFEEALDRLHNTPPPTQQPAPRRRTGH